MPDDRRGTPLERSMEAFQETVRRSGPAAMGSYTLIGAIIMFGGIDPQAVRNYLLSLPGAVDAVRAETTMARGARGRGRLGVGMRRDVGTVRQGGQPAYVDALNDVVIAIMVEKKSCVDNLDEILKVPGIDMVQFGASDFSMSIGKPAQYSDREVLEAETHVIRTALKKGKNPRVELRDPSQAEKYLAMGVKHFCIGWDVRILADWWDAKGAEMRKMLRSKPAKAKSAPAKAPTRKGNGRDVVRGNYT